MPNDIEQLKNILRSNANKSFVKRILEPDKYPVLNNPDGSWSTHSMAWDEADGKFYVYPTVLWNGKQLKRYDTDKAWDHAMKTGNFIEFDSPEEADWFSKEYKQVWQR